MIVPEQAWGCCAVGAAGIPVVNADQTVILWWDQANQTEHFIRRASFQGGGEMVGFLVPSPSRPQLEEAGDAAFPYLANLTQPVASGGGFSLGCSVVNAPARAQNVRVIEEKTVAGYDAVVLSVGSGEALMAWLNQNDFAFRPETAAWAEPYVKNGWYISAMKIAKKQRSATAKTTASALRISFKTDRPLFPYREPDSRNEASELGIKNRLLRIYFIAESTYNGSFSSGQSWPATIRTSMPLKSEDRTQLLDLLKLPSSTGPSQVWLTEIEHHWPYGIAPGDVYFAPVKSNRVHRAGFHLDVTLLILAGWFGLQALCKPVKEFVFH